MVCSRVIVAADSDTGALIAAAAACGGGHRLAPLSRLMSERMHTKWGPPGPSMYSLLSFPSLFLESPFAVHDSAERVPTCSTADGGVRVLEMQFTAHTPNTAAHVYDLNTHTSTHCRQLSVIHRGHIHTLTGYVTEIRGRWPPPLPSSPLRAQSGPTLVTQLKLR